MVNHQDKNIIPMEHFLEGNVDTLIQMRRVTNTNLLFRWSKWLGPKFVDKNPSAEFLVPHLQFSNNLFHFFFHFLERPWKRARIPRRHQCLPLLQVRTHCIGKKLVFVFTKFLNWFYQLGSAGSKHISFTSFLKN